MEGIISLITLHYLQGMVMAFCIFKASPVRDSVLVKNFANCFQQTLFAFPLAVSESVKDRYGIPAVQVAKNLPSSCLV